MGALPFPTRLAFLALPCCCVYAHIHPKALWFQFPVTSLPMMISCFCSLSPRAPLFSFSSPPCCYALSVLRLALRTLRLLGQAWARVWRLLVWVGGLVVSFG